MLSPAERAMYLISLPLAQFRAIQRAVRVVARGGMCRESALELIVQHHYESHLRREKYRAS